MEQSVPKHRHQKFRRRGLSQRKEYNIHTKHGEHLKSRVFFSHLNVTPSATISVLNNLLSICTFLRFLNFFFFAAKIKNFLSALCSVWRSDGINPWILNLALVGVIYKFYASGTFNSRERTVPVRDHLDPRASRDVLGNSGIEQWFLDRLVAFNLVTILTELSRPSFQIQHLLVWTPVSMAEPKIQDLRWTRFRASPISVPSSQPILQPALDPSNWPLCWSFSNLPCIIFCLFIIRNCLFGNPRA